MGASFTGVTVVLSVFSAPETAVLPPFVAELSVVRVAPFVNEPAYVSSIARTTRLVGVPL